jgi:hypothetical protein
MTTVELRAVELTPAACDDVIVTSSHRQCMDEHVDLMSDDPQAVQVRRKEAWHAGAYNKSSLYVKV